MATNPVTLDFSRAVPVNQPTQPTSPTSSAGGVTLDFSHAQPIDGQTSSPQQSGLSTGVTHGTLTATPQPDSVPARVEQWAEDVKNDLLNGTDNTKVGSLLKFLGAPGLAKGVSPGVAEFMGSPLLGPMRLLKGTAELPQSGKRWESVKNTLGGVLDTATIPGAFMAPEAGELAGAGGEAVLDQAGRAAKAAKGAVSVKALQPKLQSAITSAIQDAAAEHGIAIPDGTNLRDVTQALSNTLRAKAHGLYQQLDNALGGTRFQGFQEAIENLQHAIRDEVGIDPARDKQLADRLSDAKAARDAAVEQLRAKGIDPATIDQADALYRKAMALQDVSKAVRASADVHPSQIANGATNTAATNVRTKPLWNRLQQLATPNPKYPGSSRLVQALGEERAAQLLHDVDAAHLATQKIMARNAWLKRGASAVGLTGAGAAAYHFTHGLLSDQ